MRKKIFLLILFSIFIVTPNVYAGQARGIIQNEIKSTVKAIKEEIKPTIAAIREETRNEIKERLKQASTPAEREEIRKEIREQNKGILEQIRNQVKEKLQNLRFSARVTGKITEKGENSIKVQAQDGKVYRVNITEKTQLRRRFWGKADLSEFSVGDEVNVIGRYTNEEKTIIDAILIRNLSIQKRWGVFFGKVTSKGADNFVMETVKRGKVTVYFGSAKFVNRRDETIVYGDIQVDHRVRVRGVWDKALSKIIEVEEVKDFSLPPVPTKVVTPTQTP